MYAASTVRRPGTDESGLRPRLYGFYVPSPAIPSLLQV